MEIKNILVYRQSTDPEKGVFDVRQNNHLNEGKKIPIIHNFNFKKKGLGYAELKFINDEIYADLYLYQDVNTSLNPAIGFISSGEIFAIGLCLSNNTDKNIRSLGDQLYAKNNT